MTMLLRCPILRLALVLTFAGFVGTSCVYSQANVRNFYLYNVDTSSYPRVTANVFALDNANQRYKNLSVTDFDLFENG
ncbi:MAG: hypothetical protein ACKOAG_04085, partial [Candidatus Kapaibacterium sp.]